MEDMWRIDELLSEYGASHPDESNKVIYRSCPARAVPFRYRRSGIPY